MAILLGWLSEPDEPKCEAHRRQPANHGGQSAVTKEAEGNDEKAAKFAEERLTIALTRPNAGEAALMLLNKRAVLVGARDVCGEVLLKQLWPYRLAEDIELTVADKPVLRVRLDDRTPGQ